MSDTHCFTSIIILMIFIKQFLNMPDIIIGLLDKRYRSYNVQPTGKLGEIILKKFVF